MDVLVPRVATGTILRQPVGQNRVSVKILGCRTAAQVQQSGGAGVPAFGDSSFTKSHPTGSAAAVISPLRAHAVVQARSVMHRRCRRRGSGAVTHLVDAATTFLNFDADGFPRFLRTRGRAGGVTRTPLARACVSAPHRAEPHKPRIASSVAGGHRCRTTRIAAAGGAAVEIHRPAHASRAAAPPPHRYATRQRRRHAPRTGRRCADARH